MRGFLTDSGLTPSEASAFSPQRPLQLHFVTFRRSKVTADVLTSGSASANTEDSSKTSNPEGSDADGDEGKTALEINDFRFASDLEPLARTQTLSELVARSTQGVAVLGLGSRAFWNPAEQDTDLVLAAMRKAILAAEAADAECTAARANSVSPTASEGPATGALSKAENVSERRTLDLTSAARREGQGEEAGAAHDGDKAGGKAQTAGSLTHASPSFQVKEEPPRSDAPLTLAHLHRFSTVRGHWSVYTNAQVRRGFF